MAILPKGGINVAGHKIPWEAIAAIAGVLGVILVIRARQQSGAVASVGQAPASSAIDPSLLGFGSTTGDISGALSSLSTQLAQLQQQGINSAPPASTFQVAMGNPGWSPVPGSGWGGAPGQLPLYGPKGITWVPATTPLQVVGSIDASGGVPVNYLGQVFDITPSQWDINSSSIQPATFRAPGS